jgi:hypothetical protein
MLAWGSRWGGMPIEEKQKIGDQIDDQLRSYGASNAEIGAIKDHYVSLIGYDLIHFFEDGLYQYVSSTAANLDPVARLEWSNEFLTRERLRYEKLLVTEPLALSGALKSEIPRNLVRPEDLDKFEHFANRIGELYAACRARGGYTNDATSFLNEFSALAGPPLVARILE